MKTINHYLYAMIAQALKSAGTYDPEQVLPYFEESLTIAEAQTLTKFLQWCHDNDKPFGHGNYKERFKEWRLLQ